MRSKIAVEILDDEILVTMPGTTFSIVYEAASNRNKTAKTRPAFEPINSGIGTLKMAACARGRVAAIAAVTRGTATNNPTTGKGFETATMPADPAAAAIPIHSPANVARISFALGEASMKVMTALTASTISADVAMKPRKSSILSPAFSSSTRDLTRSRKADNQVTHFFRLVEREEVPATLEGRHLGVFYERAVVLAL